MLRKWSVLFISSFTLIFLFQNCGQFESQGGLTTSSSSSFNNFSSDEINPNAPLGVYAMDSSSIENREMVIELKLNKSDLSDITIQWETADGVAMSGKHYEASSGSAVIRAGQTSTDIRIPILRSEMATDVAFMVRVLSTSKGQIAKELATASILAGSAAPVLANVWSPLNINGAPSARVWHSAVWTGSKMIVFGGSNQGRIAFNNGGIYDLATNSWSSLSTNGAPSARNWHSAVWTGSKMIVFGGFSRSSLSPLGSGGVYDLATDSWSPLNTTGAPSARQGHSAVWTGSKMIVFGGYYGNGNRGGGGIYDPATDSWSSLNTTGAPSARGYHSAVWTGSKMIVFGGFSGNSVNNGGIYDPATDSWSPLNTTGAPSARGYHSAVWTGSKMIVFGGFSGDGSSGSSIAGNGGIYDPATDSWSPLNINGAPSARQGHAAVWTGSEMIIFGGYDGSNYLRDGGVFK